MYRAARTVYPGIGDYLVYDGIYMKSIFQEENINCRDMSNFIYSNWQMFPSELQDGLTDIYYNERGPQYLSVLEEESGSVCCVKLNGKTTLFKHL